MGSRRTWRRSTNEVQEPRAQLRTPPGEFPLLTAFIIHFFSSCVPSSSDPCDSEASSGAEISCIARRKSEAAVYGIAKAKDVSCEIVEKELEELGRRMAEMLLGTLFCEGAELMELDSENTRVTRAVSWTG